jgi:hypothetical protein
MGTLGTIFIIWLIVAGIAQIFGIGEDPGKRNKNINSLRRCDNCGSSQHVQDHHIHPVQYGGSDSPSNIILLCKDCHEEEHNFQFEEDQWRDGARKALPKYQIIRNAIETNGRLSITYRSGGQTPKQTQREIDPLKLYREDYSYEGRQGGYHMYLKAFCHLRNAERTFRVGRIKKITTIS